MNTGPLNENELEWLDETLAKYATEGAILDVSELDGLLTAILSAPTDIEPAQWLVAIWGGADNVPRWANDRERDRFVDLTLQHMSDIAERLESYPDQFEPLFGTREAEGQELTIVEEWCFGYLRGVALSDWSTLPAELKPALDAIALHGSEAQFTALDNLTADEFIDSIERITPAALALYQYWMANPCRWWFRSRSEMRRRSDATIPCPCGSGKSIKQCCLAK
ncbi:YecA family protein [Klebsiella variicola subsp. variicola]|nr:YecA family protein [Klebsiella variicola subsp. variicola]